MTLFPGSCDPAALLGGTVRRAFCESPQLSVEADPAEVLHVKA